MTKEKIQITPPTFVEKSFKILDKRSKEVPFILNRAQRYYEKKKKNRNIVLKARQQGISKYLLARRMPYFLTRAVNCLLLSNEKDATQRMMSAAKQFLKTMDVTIDFENDEAAMIRTKLPSTYFIGTAGQAIVGRGDTLHFAHLSEAAFYKDLKNVLNAIVEACEFGQIDIESTPNGHNDFKDLYKKAKAGESSFNAIFIPWFMSEEYSIEFLEESDIQNMTPYMQQIYYLPDDEVMNNLSDAEKKLIRIAKEEYDIDFTAGMIKWRRYKIADKADLFFQEYPEDDESCFLRSDRGVFISIEHDEQVKVPLDDLRSWRDVKDLHFEDAEDEMIKYRQKKLYAGLDPAKGTPDGDYHVFAVYDPMRAVGKGAFVYEYRSREPIDIFAEKILKICKNYNITLGVESNGVGAAMVMKLNQLDANFTDWQTNGTNRPVMIAELSEAYRKQEIIEGYKEAKEEAMSMIYTKSDRPEHPTNGHDDRVFARAIALQMSKTPEYAIVHL